MRISPITLREANAFVKSVHRHHGPVVGHKFALAVRDSSGALRGVAICGRPVARRLDTGDRLEVLRVATDGASNACSMLYGAAARVAREMGYEAGITYTLETEPGTSLRASGWKEDGVTPGRSWSVPSRQRSDKHPLVPKTRWVRQLREVPAPSSYNKA